MSPAYCPSTFDAERLFACSLDAGQDGDHVDIGREGEPEMSWPSACADCGSVGPVGPVEADGRRYCAACLGPDPEPDFEESR